MRERLSVRRGPTEREDGMPSSHRLGGDYKVYDSAPLNYSLRPFKDMQTLKDTDKRLSKANPAPFCIGTFRNGPEDSDSSLHMEKAAPSPML
ncbi:hypothetical protein Y1Q_0020571 [Alligator mississippiensis]|uniref:Uncharacterized protein n=1 Tax=Alligator mississippiensis TaxID=8496 RepID=A0A151PJ68_ALLMI|nr:hypothetical protein Y1Q_0020571 [Alligator mississippiensis]